MKKQTEKTKRDGYYFEEAFRSKCCMTGRFVRRWIKKKHSKDVRRNAKLDIIKEL